MFLNGPIIPPNYDYSNDYHSQVTVNGKSIAKTELQLELLPSKPLDQKEYAYLQGLKKTSPLNYILLKTLIAIEGKHQSYVNDGGTVGFISDKLIPNYEYSHKVDDLYVYLFGTGDYGISGIHNPFFVSVKKTNFQNVSAKISKIGVNEPFRVTNLDSDDYEKYIKTSPYYKKDNLILPKKLCYGGIDALIKYVNNHIYKRLGLLARKVLYGALPRRLATFHVVATACASYQLPSLFAKYYTFINTLHELTIDQFYEYGLCPKQTPNRIKHMIENFNLYYEEVYKE